MQFSQLFCEIQISLCLNSTYFYVNDHQPRPDMLLEKIQYKKNKRQLGPVCSLTCCSVFYLLANGNMCVMVSTIFTFSNALSADELIAAKRGICYIWVQRGTSWSQPSSYSYSTIMTAPQSSSLRYVMCPCILYPRINNFIVPDIREREN